MLPRNLIYIGIRGTVLALDRATGQTAWQANLIGADFVNVVQDNGELYAATKGEVFRLDPSSGEIRWHNKLPGMGRGLVTFAGAEGQQSLPIREKQRRDEEAAAAGAVVATS